MSVPAKEILKNARFELGFTQKEFADSAGVNQAALSLWERGARKPGFRNLKKIVDMLKTKGITVGYKDFEVD